MTSIPMARAELEEGVRSLSDREAIWLHESEGRLPKRFLVSAAAAEVGGLEPVRLEDAFAGLQWNRPELRTRYSVSRTGQVSKEPAEGAVIPVLPFDLRDTWSPVTACERLIDQLIENPGFNLLSGESIRCVAIRVSDIRTMVVVILHRIAGDQVQARLHLDSLLAASGYAQKHEEVPYGKGNRDPEEFRKEPSTGPGSLPISHGPEHGAAQRFRFPNLGGKRGTGPKPKLEIPIHGLSDRLGRLAHVCGASSEAILIAMFVRVIARYLGLSGFGAEIEVPLMPGDVLQSGPDRDARMPLSAECEWDLPLSAFARSMDNRIIEGNGGSNRNAAIHSRLQPPDGGDQGHRLLFAFETYPATGPGEGTRYLPLVLERWGTDIQICFIRIGDMWRAVLSFDPDLFHADAMDCFMQAVSAELDRVSVATAFPPLDGCGTGVISLATDTEAALTHRQRIFLEACAAALGRKEIGLKNEFFALGGDSLAILKVFIALEKEGFSVDIGSFYSATTLADVEKQVVPIVPSDAPAIEVLNPFALTPFQLFFLREARDSSWNIVHSVPFPERVDAERLRDVLEKAWNRHDALRLRFRRHEKEFPSDCGWRVWIPAPVDSPLQFQVYKHAGRMDSGPADVPCIKAFSEGIGPSSVSLVAFVLVDYLDGQVLYLIGSHLILDLNAANILSDWISKAYHAPEVFNPNAGSLSYAKAMNAIYGYASGPGFLQEIPFWSDAWMEGAGNRLIGDESSPNEGDGCETAFQPRRILLEGAVLSSLTAICRENAVSLADLLLAIVQSSILEVCNVDGLGISFIVPGRNAAALGLDLSGVIGSFGTAPFLPLGSYRRQESFFENASRIKKRRLGIAERGFWMNYVGELPYYQKRPTDDPIVDGLNKAMLPMESNILFNYIEGPAWEGGRERILQGRSHIGKGVSLAEFQIHNCFPYLVLDWSYNRKRLPDLQASRISSKIALKLQHSAMCMAG